MSENYKHPYLSAFFNGFKSLCCGDIFMDKYDKKIKDLTNNSKYFSLCKNSGRVLGILFCTSLATLPFYIAGLYKMSKEKSSEPETSDLINPLDHSNPIDSLEKTINDSDKINSQS